MSEIRKQKPDEPAVQEISSCTASRIPSDWMYMTSPTTISGLAPGWVVTVEPAIYLKQEGFGVRLENTVVVTANGPVDLMADIPIEAGDIERLMRRH